jgi:hypothetical protein
MMKKLLVAAALVFGPAVAFAQDSATVRKLFEAGHYQQVLEAAQGDADAPILYTAAQSHQRLGANDQAMGLYQQLANRPEGTRLLRSSIERPRSTRRTHTHSTTAA